jgi:hypothetical protein
MDISGSEFCEIDFSVIRGIEPLGYAVKAFQLDKD